MRICREQAAREGWRVIASYKDAAISGSSVTLRPGIQELLDDARSGKFDLVLAEALDRISRDQADIATLYKHLQFAGITIVTLAEGEISELHVGLKGTMNALFLKDLAKKTHRGLRGRVEKGKSGGGLSYGYDLVRRLDAGGEPIRGERTINLVEAEVIRRIFRDYANGISPLAIATRLNAEGIPGPYGKLWGSTTLRGHTKRGTGLLNNELYVGRLVWNRQRYLKNPQTGRRVSRLNPESEWITTEVPELRILDDELWQAVKARQTAHQIDYVRSMESGSVGAKLRMKRRPKSLLSGLLVCGTCNGPVALRGQDRFGCSAHIHRRSCTNVRTIKREVLEARVLEGLRHRLMAPDIVAEAVHAYVEETNRLNHQQRAAANADKAELKKVTKAIERLVNMAADGDATRGLVDKLLALEAQEDAIRARMNEAPYIAPDIHPNIAQFYRKKVERLSEALHHPSERDEAARAIRGLIERVTLFPGAKPGEMTATLHGEFGAIMEWASQHETAANNCGSGSICAPMSVSVVAGVGFEPTTFRL
ncbi:recombinase family protein [Novosphingobium sp.]|uniref:recombinase family protein n=1 Tax=Novosphingobium sp. TaxID=1874826 RepID=UPI0025FBA489|nr:recombinase family protein [Novosphingobium sp.]